LIRETLQGELSKSRIEVENLRKSKSGLLWENLSLMAEWDSIKLKFSALDPIKSPIKSTLSALKAVEAVLEAILGIVQAFSIDFGNPLKAIVELLLASIRSLINQIRSTGFSILIIHPDFSRKDFSSVLNSVSGSYPKFESKVINKIYDTSDIFRPQYPEGSSVSTLVLYVASDKAEELVRHIFALLRIVKSPFLLTGLPAPVNLKVSPVSKSGAAISQFRRLFDSDVDKSLQLEWSMPESPSNSSPLGVINNIGSFYSQFRFPNFIIERSEKPNGEIVKKKLNSQTMGKSVESIQKRYGLPSSSTDVVIKEEDGSTFRNFEKKIVVNSLSGLTEGSLTGTYRYLDNDPDLEPGKVYSYRVRAFFGDASSFVSLKSSSDISENKDIIKRDQNEYIIRFGPDITMGKPSSVVQGYSPKPVTSGSIFNAYDNIDSAIQAAVLLNFEFPFPFAGDSITVQDQKTGWGTLSVLGNQISLLKSTFKNSSSLKNSFPFKTTCRRISNQVSSKLYSNPALLDLIAQKWVSGVGQTVTSILETNQSWSFIGILEGITEDSKERISEYLSFESSYSKSDSPHKGPCPLSSSGSSFSVSADERRQIADFIRLTISSLSGDNNYLSWYSVSLGDILPGFVPFAFDFEQFILSLLKAINSAAQEIEDIIETILQKIRALEAILESIDALIDLLNVDVQVSAFSFSSNNGSTESIANAILSSESKPSDSASGFHSGIVMTAGGPGESFVAALKALSFILQIKSLLSNNNMAFSFSGTFTSAQWEALKEFGFIQRSDLEKRKLWLQAQLSRNGIFITEYDSDTNKPVLFDCNSGSYGKKLLDAYRILGGIPERDMLLRTSDKPVFLTRGSNLQISEGSSQGGYSDVFTNGRRNRGNTRFDRDTGVLIDRFKNWQLESIKHKRENLEYKIKRCLDYSDQIQNEIDLIDKIMSDGFSSFDNTLSRIENDISSPGKMNYVEDSQDDFGLSIGKIGDLSVDISIESAESEGRRVPR
jgi:hypothetical protein